jgi:hypothetical protein
VVYHRLLQGEHLSVRKVVSARAFFTDALCYCLQLGLASQLKVTPANEVRKSEYHQKLKEIEREKTLIEWPKNADQLPVVSWEECEFVSGQSRPSPLMLTDRWDTG